MLQVGTHFIISNLSCCFIVLGFYYAEAIDQICMHIYIALICTKKNFWGCLKWIHLSGWSQYMIFGQIMKLWWDLDVSKIDILFRKYHTRLVPYICIHVYNKSMAMCYKKIKQLVFSYSINSNVRAITAHCYHR